MDYHLPQELIATRPAFPRDSSRLFVYDTAADKIIFDRFYNLDKYLPHDSFLVLNKTKVLPARLNLFKETSGRVEVLLLINELQAGDKVIKSLSDRKLIVGQKLFFCGSAMDGGANTDSDSSPPAFFVTGQNKNIFLLRPNFRIGELRDILLKYGSTPIPKYIKSSPLAERDLRKKYQTVFASVDKCENRASVAAPTASLHFTKRVFKKLQRQKIPHIFVTLNIGLGTFAPVTQDNFKNKKLFNEYYEIEKSAAEKIAELKRNGKKLIAVGTTVARTLESFAATQKTKNATDLFIFPPYDFKLVDCLVTNFHLPSSSLMMLVEAFLQHKKAPLRLIDLYKIATKNRFRFYSFGDAMMIL
ncbi:tRNA preQ1(34) S-adenosylmethionine ribosyltransferase-isomerase QueA [Candidatus Peregrinibacteria bacterium]|nr:tRNA preQ1(34) S-adenosylmethionine ribosyltransferase-isomerase QueA [Candidatus Peregrinibacteria bacterium]